MNASPEGSEPRSATTRLRPHALGAALLAATLAAGSACTTLALGGDDDGWSRAIADRIADDLARIERSDGVLVELGTVPGAPETEVESRVRFRAPGDVIIETLAPDAYRGDVLAHTGSTIHIVSRRLRAGIRIRNVPRLDAAARGRLLREKVRHDLATYAFAQGPVERIAGRPGVLWTVTPFDDGDMRLRQRTHADAEHGFALATVLLAPGGGERPLYRMRWRKIALNADVPDGELVYRPEPDIRWIDWDLASAPLSLGRARAAADFALLRAPDDAELARTRIIAADTAHPPMLCLVHERPPFWATVTQTKDRGLRDPKERGVPHDLDGAPARVVLGGPTTTISFVRAGVDVTVVTNLPLDRAIAFARSLQSDTRRPTDPRAPAR